MLTLLVVVQIQCTACGVVSNLDENMMDLAIEIHGDAKSLEGCLDQFIAWNGLMGTSNADVTGKFHLLCTLLISNHGH